MSRYIRPKLTGHKLLYRGRRYWVFEVGPEYPFEGMEEYGDLVFYDCFLNASITHGKRGEDGVIRGSLPFGQGSVDVKGRTIKEFVEDTVQVMDWIDRAWRS